VILELTLSGGGTRRQSTGDINPEVFQLLTSALRREEGAEKVRPRVDGHEYGYWMGHQAKRISRRWEHDP
jgi:hypothetical protein